MNKLIAAYLHARNGDFANFQEKLHEALTIRAAEHIIEKYPEVAESFFRGAKNFVSGKNDQLSQRFEKRVGDLKAKAKADPQNAAKYKASADNAARRVKGAFGR